ncbi:sensor histidine kinase [Oerskovia paurometabola]|uniref:histidine kinase n=1 Tax=Oerskovia paurometabola TaxID=162170 RepID=A0ABW1XDS9_9CELL|nr:HAMP domain-containing sensor histidine kinase [Oerskovia paurometabola]MBM7496118.1 two-component system OmpR family sensor kinase [Oerskovia paurometabola]
MTSPRASLTARPHTLRRQLVTVLVGILLVLSVALAVSSTLALRQSLVDRLDDELVQASQRAERGPFDRPGDGAPPAQDPGDGTSPGEAPSSGTGNGDPLPPGQGAGTINVVYADGEVQFAGYVDDLGDRRELDAAQIADLESVPADGRPHDVEVTDLGTFRAISTTTEHGEPSITAMSTASVSQTVEGYLLVEVILAGVGIAIASVLGTWLVRRSLRPLDSLADAAVHVSELPLDRGEVGEIPRVDEQFTDERTEVGQVGAALNRMLDHVEASLTARHESETQVRQFVADASHELRTPLASIRGYSELVRRSPDDVPPDTLRALDRIESEALRMGDLVEDLLLLARLDAGRPLDREPVDLAALAIDAVADAHAASRDHVWELDLPVAEGDGPVLDGDEAAAEGDVLWADGDDTFDLPDVTVVGDEARLRQVFANLLGNARVHTPPGTRVVVGVRPDGDDHVVLSVTDDGPGIPDSLRPSLFQRFSRGDSARNRVGGSTGLGLAIAQAVVQAHGGEITVRDAAATALARPSPTGTGADDAGRAPSSGTTFEVRLPRG